MEALLASCWSRWRLPISVAPIAAFFMALGNRKIARTSCSCASPILNASLRSAPRRPAAAPPAAALAAAPVHLRRATGRAAPRRAQPTAAPRRTRTADAGRVTADRLPQPPPPPAAARRAAAEPAKASSSASAPAGSSGSAASRSRSAAFSWCSYAIEQGLSARGCASSLGALLAARAGRGRRMGAPQRESPASSACRARTSRASSPRPAPPSPSRPSMPPMRSMILGAGSSPSCCSAPSRSRRSRPRCCMARRSRRSASSAPKSMPLMVSTDQPNYWALYIYLAVVTAAAFALARMRLWRWLAITAVVVRRPVDVARHRRPRVDVLIPHAFHIVVGFALVAALIVSGFLFGPDAEPGDIDRCRPARSPPICSPPPVLVLASATMTHLALSLFVRSWPSRPSPSRGAPMRRSPRCRPRPRSPCW